MASDTVEMPPSSGDEFETWDIAALQAELGLDTDEIARTNARITGSEGEAPHLTLDDIAPALPYAAQSTHLGRIVAHFTQTRRVILDANIPPELNDNDPRPDSDTPFSGFRNAFGVELVNRDITTTKVDEYTLALGEVIDNTYEHARNPNGPAGYCVVEEVHNQLTGETKLVVHTTNATATTRKKGKAAHQGGRGLGLVSMLSDEVGRYYVDHAPNPSQPPNIEDMHTEPSEGSLLCMWFAVAIEKQRRTPNLNAWLGHIGTPQIAKF